MLYNAYCKRGTSDNNQPTFQEAWRHSPCRSRPPQGRRRRGPGTLAAGAARLTVYQRHGARPRTLSAPRPRSDALETVRGATVLRTPGKSVWGSPGNGRAPSYGIRSLSDHPGHRPPKLHPNCPIVWTCASSRGVREVEKYTSWVYDTCMT